MSDEPTTVGRYRLIRKLARGGMAEVYLARNQGARGFEKTVAIKRILPHFARDEQFVRMMVDEAKISVLLNHPNIAQIFEFGEEGGEYFLVMEYVGGQSLSKLVKRLRKAGKSMEILEAVFVVLEMLQGLHAAHSQKNSAGEPANIIHRDVSPQNVLVSWDGHLKVIDFGIARAKNRLEHTEVGTIKGKLRYLAPEMIDPARFSRGGDFDHRVDIFAAGIVLFELVAGRTLFSGANELEVYDMITGADVPDLVAEGLVEPQLMEILLRSLAKDPELRYASAETMADDLRAFLYSHDPTFTAKRIGALMRTFFSAEREALMQIEKADAEGAYSGARELNLTRTGFTPSRVDRVKATTADRKSSSRSNRKSGSNTGSNTPSTGSQSIKSTPRITGIEPGVAPDAETRVAFTGEFSTPNTPVGGRGVSDEDDTRTRLPMPGEPEDPLTPATDTALLASRESRSKKKNNTVVIVLAAASSVAVLLAALIIVGLMQIDDPVVVDPTKPKDPTQPVQPTQPTPGKLPVLVDAEPSSALVEIVGRAESRRSVPAVFMAKPGETIEVRVTAEHYEAQREKVVVPQSGEARVSVALRAMPVPLVVETAPDGARVSVGGKPYKEGMTVTPGTELVVSAVKRGYREATRKVRATPGTPLSVALELRKKEKAVSAKPAGKGSLTITTTPYWGRVNVDGRTLDETTPVTVTLKAGTHTVTVSHPPKGLVKRFKVTIKAGAKLRRTVQF